MRRAQSTRNRPRPSGYASTVDELGSLRESEETVEDTLRRQLMDKERENDRLLMQIEVLQAQLQERPPADAVQRLKEDHQALEILLAGTQAENKKCMKDLDRSRAREKLLERELVKLVGENWQAALDVQGVSHHSLSASTSSVPATPTTSSSAPGKSNAETLAFVQEMRTLILGMESRLCTREEALSVAIQRAEAEGKKYDGLTRDGAIPV